MLTYSATFTTTCPGQRSKVCHVRHHREGKDDSDFVIDAMRRCNNGGHVIFHLGITYIIGTALGLTFFKNIDIGTNCFSFSIEITLMNSLDIQGKIQFTNDTTYWQANSFRFAFQNATGFWQFGGEDVAIYVSLVVCSLDATTDLVNAGRWNR